MEIDPKIKSLLDSFVELCDSIVEDAYVVTNGIRIAGVVLEESLAKHLCRKTIAAYNPEEQELAKQEWVVCSISKAIQYAFTRGFKEGHTKAVCQFEKNFIQKQNDKVCEEVSSEKLAQTYQENDNVEGENS